MKPDSGDILNLLPALQPSNRLTAEAGDIIIAAPGFEDRTLALAAILSAQGIVKALLLKYEPHDARNRLADLENRLRLCGIKECSTTTYNRFEPGDFETRLQDYLVAQKPKRVIIDISTMSKLLIMLTLNVIRDLKLKVLVFYAEAETYWPTEAGFEEARTNNRVHQPSLQVFTGVHGVVRVDSLASVAMQGQQTAAIVFMSFNDALTQVLLNTVYPGRLFLVNGRPPQHHWRERATAWIHDQVRREWEGDNPVHDAASGEVALPKRATSTLDYRETVLLLLELYWELSAGHRILLAPAGSKLQSLGCYMVKALHRDIHIEYPSPTGFMPEYSTGVGATWQLDLGDLSDRLDQISNVERRLYLEIDTSVLQQSTAPKQSP